MITHFMKRELITVYIVTNPITKIIRSMNRVLKITYRMINTKTTIVDEN